MMTFSSLTNKTMIPLCSKLFNVSDCIKYISYDSPDFLEKLYKKKQRFNIFYFHKKGTPFMAFVL